MPIINSSFLVVIDTELIRQLALPYMEFLVCSRPWSCILELLRAGSFTQGRCSVRLGWEDGVGDVFLIYF